MYRSKMSREVLDLSGRGLTELPDLSNYTDVIHLRCDHNQLTTFENVKWPPSLRELYCSNNRLTSLDTLPSSLIQLCCINNLLSSLDHLPPTLTCLYCVNNPFSYPFQPITLQAIRDYNTNLANLYLLK